MHLLELDTADDISVWEYAKLNDFIIVTKDADFADISVLQGFPPKIVWIRKGNCSTNEIEELLRNHHAEIEKLMLDLSSGILTIF